MKDKLIKKEKPSSERVISEKAKVLIEKHDINVDSIPDEVISKKIIMSYTDPEVGNSEIYFLVLRFCL